ncbi:MAG: ATP-binding protein, partial [Bacteroidales bacterium]
MKRKKEIEYSIRFNAALIYIVVGLACCMMVFYLYNVRGSIGEQKKEIEQQKRALALTNKLVYTVSEIQSSGELYLSTKEKRYLRRFNHKILEVELIIDSIAICTHRTVQQTGLLELDSLLRRQYEIIGELGKRLNVQNPLQEVNQKLQDYIPPIKQDSVVVTTVRRDTVVRATRKKGFFKRLANVFAPAKDSVMVLSDKQIDTLHIEHSDTSTIITRVDSAVRLAGVGYSQNIKAIEYNVGKLAVSDKKIMEQISGLLLNMYGKTLNSIFTAIDKSEKIISRNYTYSIIGGVVALMLVLLFIVLIVLSVNKGKEARLALEELNRKNREIMESRHKLLLSVSHDIKTPLGSILGYLEMRKGDGYDVRSMQSSGNYILSLLENLIEFSSIEQGRLKISKAPFKLDDFFAAIIDMFEPLAIKKRIAFEGIRNFDKDLVICSDYLKIKQITVNLISNAIKYTTAGTVKLQVSYCNGDIVCKITDTGAGIPAHYQEKIFVPFQRVERNNILAEGSGLGLYVVKGLVELLGGKIHLTSKVGQGSEFTVVLPVAAVENNIPRGIKHITIIDDDPVLLSMAAEMLIKLGHKVATASSIEDIGACDMILA